MSRLKLAELTSGLGALALGVGLGALFAARFAPAATVILVAGIVMHGFGMWDKHRLESGTQARREPWVVAAYWVCWLALAGLAIYLLVRR